MADELMKKVVTTTTTTETKPAPVPSIARVPNHSVVTHRDGKSVFHPPGKAAKFTSDEITSILTQDPLALRKPIDEASVEETYTGVTQEELDRRTADAAHADEIERAREAQSLAKPGENVVPLENVAGEKKPASAETGDDDSL